MLESSIMKTIIVTIFITLNFSISHRTYAQSIDTDELNPFDQNIEQQLIDNDLRHISDRVFPLSTLNFKSNCYRETCPVYIEIDKSRQMSQLFVNGVPLESGEWLSTTGMKGYETPNFDQSLQKPLRAYTKYTSSKYPGGDWNGLGNMPYAVFIQGGFAIHGTPLANIKRLGTVPLSHGCIRVDPHNGKIFNDLVKKYGPSKTWVWVHD